MPIAPPLKRSSIYHAHRTADATLADYHGWHLPSAYASLEADLEALQRSGGICDISHQGKLDLQGTDVLGFLNSTLNLPAPLGVGDSQPAALPTGAGAAFDGLTALGLSYDGALLLTLPSRVAAATEALQSQLDGCAHLVDQISSLAAILVAGPLSRRVLSRMVELDIDPSVFPNGACAQCKAAEVHLLIYRCDLAALPAFQLYVTRDFGEYLWDALLHAAVPDGVRPVGLDAIHHLQGDS